MKKIFLIISVMTLVIGGLTQDNLLWSFRLMLDEPVTHTVDKGEYLSGLSLKYYGSPDYWRELALLNRAPDPNLVYPDEKVIIPDFENILAVKKARTMTEVNQLVAEIEKNLDGKNIEVSKPIKQETSSTVAKPDSKFQKPDIKSSPVKSSQIVLPENSDSPVLYVIVLTGAAIALLLLVILYVRQSRKKKKKDVNPEEPVEDSLEKSFKAEEVYVN